MCQHIPFWLSPSLTMYVPPELPLSSMCAAYGQSEAVLQHMCYGPIILQRCALGTGSSLGHQIGACFSLGLGRASGHLQ
jgi:hypothetical protein